MDPRETLRELQAADAAATGDFLAALRPRVDAYTLALDAHVAAERRWLTEPHREDLRGAADAAHAAAQAARRALGDAWAAGSVALRATLAAAWEDAARDGTASL